MGEAPWRNGRRYGLCYMQGTPWVFYMSRRDGRTFVVRETTCWQ